MLIEFAVKFDNSHTADTLASVLDCVEGIKYREVNTTTETVILESSVPVSQLLSKIDAAGFPVLFRGVSSTAKCMQGCDFGSGVATLICGERVYGLCRLFQPSDEYVLVDTVIDNLSAHQKLRVVIHKCGDLSADSYSCGDVFISGATTGDLGIVETNEHGCASLIVEKQGLNLCDLIGRSVVVHDAITESRLACGVIARSAVLSQNKKKVCLCSGKTLWEERTESPFA